MFIVDAHLDLAYNVTRGRDVTLPAAQQTVTHDEIPTVGLPDLLAGNVALVCATIFTEPARNGLPGYASADQARTQALVQRDWYLSQQTAGRLRCVTSRSDLPSPGSSGPATAAILLMEGADPFRSPDDVSEWFAAGLRIVGLAWKRTRFAGGTGDPGPLTAAGLELLPALDRVGMIHDASHLAEESFWQLLDRSNGPVIATHSNCRAIVPTDRQLSDDMIRAIVARGGVVGINFFDRFLLPPTEYGTRRATLQDLVRHIRHICDLAGDCRHVGLGSDMDGGLGREQIPVEITTAADLPKISGVLTDSGFNSTSVDDILGGNWLRYFQSHLPEK